MSWYDRLKKNAERNAKKNQMYLCPEPEQLDDLIKGLVVNRERYGYPSCPCRISSGILKNDKDIICPCDYRNTVCVTARYTSVRISTMEKKPLSPFQREDHTKK